MASGEGRPLLLRRHWLLEPVVMVTVAGVPLAVAVAAGQGELPVALPARLLTQLVPVVLDVRLLLQPAGVGLQHARTHARTHTHAHAHTHTHTRTHTLGALYNTVILHIRTLSGMSCPAI